MHKGQVQKLLGSENIAATRSVRIESVLISVIVAMTNHRIAIPKNPDKKDDGPLVDIIKLIRKLAITTDHHGNMVWNKNAKTAVNPIFNITLKLFIIWKLMSVKK